MDDDETGTVLSKATLFEWQIQGDCINRIESEWGSLYSPEFLFCGHPWYIAMHERSEECPGTMEVTLWTGDCFTPLPPTDIRVTFGVRKCDGSVEEGKSCTIGGVDDCTDGTILPSHGDLERRKSELLPLDTLTVTCRMEVEGATAGVQRKVDVAVQCAGNDDVAGLETLSSDLTQLLSGEERCDVTLRVSDREFKAHRAVLVTRSPVFRAMFRHGTAEERTGVVEIRDCGSESFGAFLRHLYSGKFDGVTSDNAIDLYVTADKYGVLQLKAFCVKYAQQNVTVENVCQLVIFADHYDEVKLMSAAQRFFNVKAFDIIQTAEWQTFLDKHQKLANNMFLQLLVQTKVGPS